MNPRQRQSGQQSSDRDWADAALIRGDDSRHFVARRGNPHQAREIDTRHELQRCVHAGNENSLAHDDFASVNRRHRREPQRLGRTQPHADRRSKTIERRPDLRLLTRPAIVDFLVLVTIAVDVHRMVVGACGPERRAVRRRGIVEKCRRSSRAVGVHLLFAADI